MKLKEGTYIVKKEDWEEFRGRVIKKYGTETFTPYPELASRDLIVYLGTSKFGWYGFDGDGQAIRTRRAAEGHTFIDYIPKPKKPKALKLTLEEAMEDADNLGNALDEASMAIVYCWKDVFGELPNPSHFNGMKTLFRKVIIRYLEEVYKEKESK